MNAIYAIAYVEAWKIHDFNGVWPVTLQYRCEVSHRYCKVTAYLIVILLCAYTYR